MMIGRFFCFLLLSGVVGVAESRHFVSGSAQTPLIELYTSEGCSSCPPAEAWLNELRDQPGLWRDFVPVAFHVNYWDRLGWTDRFSNREFTDRHYRYGSVWNVSTVYTPGFVLNGVDWRMRGRRQPPTQSADTGVLQVEIAGSVCRVSFDPAVPARNGFEVHVAQLGGGFETKVKAGENRGQTLVHEFVVLKLSSHVLRDGRGEIVLPKVKLEGMTRRAVAVWVTRGGEMAAIQATGGWLD